MLIDGIKEFEDLFSDFISNVFCRNQTNQHQARKTWNEMKYWFPSNAAENFKTDWCHYLLNSLDHEGMGIAISELKQAKLKYKYPN